MNACTTVEDRRFQRRVKRLNDVRLQPRRSDCVSSSIFLCELSLRSSKTLALILSPLQTPPSPRQSSAAHPLLYASHPETPPHTATAADTPHCPAWRGRISQTLPYSTSTPNPNPSPATS